MTETETTTVPETVQDDEISKKTILEKFQMENPKMRNNPLCWSSIDTNAISS
jgi:hypothetical protein